MPVAPEGHPGLASRFANSPYAVWSNIRIRIGMVIFRNLFGVMQPLLSALHLVTEFI
jgi:hypothetical protein